MQKSAILKVLNKCLGQLNCLALWYLDPYLILTKDENNLFGHFVVNKTFFRQEILTVISKNFPTPLKLILLSYRSGNKSSFVAMVRCPQS